MNRVVAEWRLLQTVVRSHRAQLDFALRVTIAAVLSFALSHLLDVPLPLWTVLTAVILIQGTIGRSVKATIDYLVGTLCGAIYAGAVAALIPHTNDVALAGLLAVAVAPLAFLAAINPSFGAATFTGVLVLLVPGLTHVGPIESALYRVIEVAIGGITAVVVSLLVLPARAHVLAIEAAAKMLDLMASYLPELFSGFTQHCDAGAIGRAQDSIDQAYASLDAAAAEIRHEQLGFFAAEPNLGPLLRTLLRLRHDLVTVGRAAAVPLPETLQARFEPLLAGLSQTAADYLRRCSDALANRRSPSPLDAIEAALDRCTEEFVAVRRAGLTLGLPVETVERLFALGFALEQMRHNLRDLERCVRDAARWR